MKRSMTDSHGRIMLAPILAFLILASSGCHENHPPHIGFLADWSSDGKRVVLAPFPDEEKKTVESGLWIMDVTIGRTTGLLRFPEGFYCLHPKWSCAGDQLLFGLVEFHKGEPVCAQGRISLTIWMIGSDGRGLRKIAEGSAGEDALFAPGLLGWGPSPSSVIYPEFRNDKTMPVLLDLAHGDTEDLFPRPADIYEIQRESRHGLAAALLMDTDAGKAELLMGNLAAGSWATLDVFPLSVSGDPFPRPRLHWSPDGSRLLVTESDTDQECRGTIGGGLRIYEPNAVQSRRYCAEAPNTAPFWNHDGTALAYSGKGIHILDLSRERVFSPAIEGPNYLLSWNPEDNRIYFLRSTEVTRKQQRSRQAEVVLSLFSCAADGSDVRELSETWPKNTWGWTTSPSGRHALLLDEHDVVRLLPLGCLSPAWHFSMR